MPPKAQQLKSKTAEAQQLKSKTANGAGGGSGSSQDKQPPQVNLDKKRNTNFDDAEHEHGAAKRQAGRVRVCASAPGPRDEPWALQSEAVISWSRMFYEDHKVMQDELQVAHDDTSTMESPATLALLQGLLHLSAQGIEATKAQLSALDHAMTLKLEMQAMKAQFTHILKEVVGLKRCITAKGVFYFLFFFENFVANIATPSVLQERRGRAGTRHHWRAAGDSGCEKNFADALCSPKRAMPKSI